MTGLLNHGAFHATVEREIGRAQQHDHELSVVLFDLDELKQINDTRGHAEGDRLLRRFADALSTTARESDASCRIGGDEFGLVLTDVGSDEAAQIAQRLVTGLTELDTPIQVSYGLATWPTDAQSKEMLLLHADAAVYAAKGSRTSASLTGLAGSTVAPAA